MAIIYYKDDMELKVVAAPYRGPANDAYICRDLRSATGARYVLIAIHDRECEKKLLTVLSQGKNPSSFSFARNDEMVYGFPYREPRRFTAFASHQALTGFQREQTALTLVMACIASELPPPLLYLLLTQDGILIITAQETRSQERNREIALQKLIELLRRAAHRPKRRIATKPTRASKTRRLDSKSKHAKTKRLRSARPDTD